MASMSNSTLSQATRIITHYKHYSRSKRPRVRTRTLVERQQGARVQSLKKHYHTAKAIEERVSQCRNNAQLSNRIEKLKADFGDILDVIRQLVTLETQQPATLSQQPTNVAPTPVISHEIASIQDQTTSDGESQATPNLITIQCDQKTADRFHGFNAIRNIWFEACDGLLELRFEMIDESCTDETAYSWIYWLARHLDNVNKEALQQINDKMSAACQKAVNDAHPWYKRMQNAERICLKLDKELRDVRQDYGDYKDSVDSVVKEQVDLLRKLNTLRSEKKEADEKIKGLEKQLAEKGLANTKSGFDQASNKMPDKIGSTFADYEADVSKLQSELSDTATKLEKANQSIKFCNEQIEVIVDIRNMATERLEKAERKATVLIQQRDIATKERNDARHELTHLRTFSDKQIRDIETSQAELRTELASTKQKLHDAFVENDTLRKARDDSNNKLQEAETSLASQKEVKKKLDRSLKVAVEKAKKLSASSVSENDRDELRFLSLVYYGNGTPQNPGSSKIISQLNENNERLIKDVNDGVNRSNTLETEIGELKKQKDLDRQLIEALQDKLASSNRDTNERAAGTSQVQDTASLRNQRPALKPPQSYPASAGGHRSRVIRGSNNPPPLVIPRTAIGSSPMWQNDIQYQIESPINTQVPKTTANQMFSKYTAMDASLVQVPVWASPHGVSQIRTANLNMFSRDGTQTDISRVRFQERRPIRIINPVIDEELDKTLKPGGMKDSKWAR